MVKRLMKYDFLSYLHTLIPLDLVLLGIAVLTRLIRLFENSSTGYSIVQNSSIVALSIASIVALVLTVVMCVTRYYRNLFGAEGYLTLTLPVTNDQHIFSKVLSAVIMNIISLITIILAWCIAGLGDVLPEVWKAGIYLLKELCKLVSGGHVVMWAVEAVVLGIVLTATAYLLLYCCITIGQTAKKNRIASAVGVFFGFYLLSQLVGTIGIIISISCPALVEAIEEFLVNMRYSAVDAVAWFAIAADIILSVVYGLIIRAIMKHKLNIE